MENNHDKNTQQHASYFHNGKEYKDIFEAAEAYVQEVLNQGKEDVNTQNPPPPNKTQTALTHPHHKIKKVRSFLWGLLFGALISGSFALIWIFGPLFYINKIPFMIVDLVLFVFVIKISKMILKGADDILNKLGIEGKTHLFLKWLVFGSVILGGGLAIWIVTLKTLLAIPITTLVKVPFIIEFIIYLPSIIIKISKKIDDALKKLAIKEQEHFFVKWLILLVILLGITVAVAVVVGLEISNFSRIIMIILLPIIGFFQIIIVKVIHYPEKFQKMSKKDKIIDLIGLGSIILYILCILYWIFII